MRVSDAPNPIYSVRLPLKPDISEKREIVQGHPETPSDKESVEFRSGRGARLLQLENKRSPGSGPVS